MTTKIRLHKRNSIIVSVAISGEKVKGRHPFFLFSTSQVEEVVHTLDETPIPFGPDYLVGLCLWRSIVLPVIDLLKQFGFNSDNTSDNTCYIVVRDVVPSDTGKKLERCVLKVPNKILTKKIPDSTIPVSTDEVSIDSSLLRGLFENKNNILIIPDISSILCSK